MACLQSLMVHRGAKSVKTCVMFNKVERRVVPDLVLDFVGIKCPDEFVVGYGLDWGDRFRSLPQVCVVKRSAYETPAAGGEKFPGGDQDDHKGN